MQRKCPFSDCSAKIDAKHVACANHWRKLPEYVRAAVQARLRGWKSLTAAREYVNLWITTQKGTCQQ